MRRKDKHLATHCAFEQASPRRHRLIHQQINRRNPLWALDLDGVEKGIGDSQQLFARRSHDHSQVAGCMAGGSALSLSMMGALSGICSQWYNGSSLFPEQAWQPDNLVRVFAP